MRQATSRLSVLGLVTMIMLAGCLQSASSEGAAVPLGEARSTNTPLPTFTFTPGPTATPLVVTQQVEITTVVQVTNTPGATQVAFAAQADEGEPQIQQQPTLDPLFAEATGFVQTATQEAVARTLTAEGPVQAVPTFTPTPDPLVASPTPTPSPTLLPGSDCFHEVRQGENLFRLSLRYGVLVNDIASASGVTDVNVIVVGQSLRIPDCGTTGVTPPPTSTPSRTATPFGGSSGDSGAESSGASSGTQVGGRTYFVQQGDTLFEISLRFGVPVNSIVAANPDITDANFIKMNTEIVIPGA